MKKSREKLPLISFRKNYSNVSFTLNSSELKVEEKFKIFMLLCFQDHKTQASGMALDAKFPKELALIN